MENRLIFLYFKKISNEGRRRLSWSVWDSDGSVRGVEKEKKNSFELRHDTNFVRHTHVCTSEFQRTSYFQEKLALPIIFLKYRNINLFSIDYSSMLDSP